MVELELIYDKFQLCLPSGTEQESLWQSSALMIFGGFTKCDWGVHPQYSDPTDILQKDDKNAFIFSLTNRDNTPIKITPISERYGILTNAYIW